ncbi:MAG TPA: hypothetical protein VN455_08280 [Methanotrichaceae archaeon]|nr:hypothetical protein [Methanotrichaceae archaeon]
MTRATERFGTGWQKVLFILVIVMLLISCGASGTQSGSAAIKSSSNGSYSSNMVLNVYINDAGRALVTGYVDSIDGLSFLKSSQYQYDKDTKQLYALTNSLTYKSGDDWEARMQSLGGYGEYHSIFYMPSSVVISKINSTPGLEYLVSASNESFVVDLHGYDIKDPDVTIDYQVPISGGAAASGSQSNSYLLPGLAILGFGIVSASAIVWARKGRKPAQALAELHGADAGSQVQEDAADGSSGSGINQADLPDLLAHEEGTPAEEREPAEGSCAAQVPEIEPKPEESPFPESQPPEPGDQFQAVDAEVEECLPLSAAANSKIEITSEMAAVMETLTARERAVMTALIEHSGKMTQADIRYETKIPKSSLTGIILSLERRKLIIKKEWGRTNIIELSVWFLSKRERS